MCVCVCVCVCVNSCVYSKSSGEIYNSEWTVTPKWWHHSCIMFVHMYYLVHLYYLLFLQWACIAFVIRKQKRIFYLKIGSSFGRCLFPSPWWDAGDPPLVLSSHWSSWWHQTLLLSPKSPLSWCWCLSSPCVDMNCLMRFDSSYYQ